MKLSTKGRYGLRAMIDLAVYSEKEPVSTQLSVGESGFAGDGLTARSDHRFFIL